MPKSEKLQLSNSELNKVVKIAGTDYDRRRKLTNRDISRMNKMVGKKSTREIAEIFNVSTKTVRYNTEPEYRASEIERRQNYLNRSCCTREYINELAEYKRNLIASGKKLG